MYWTTTKDSTGQKLNGANDYVVHFPAGSLLPVDAFWSISMTDAKNHLVSNPINRYSVSDRSGLVSNADGSIDIYIQNTAPTGHEQCIKFLLQTQIDGRTITFWGTIPANLGERLTGSQKVKG